jgi:hypothetical protein
MLFLLPGMGANHKMYSEHKEWEGLVETVFLDWPSYNGEKTFKAVAERLINEHKLTAKDYIGGSSLGGMVAIEIYKMLGNPKVILIGSATDKKEINPLLRKLSPLAEISPLKLIQVFAGKSQHSLLEMFTETESEFIKNMCLAINNWEGYAGPQKDIIRIHGEKDLVIKCPKVCFLIAEGGHLITMTHPMECIGFLTGEPINYAWRRNS